MFKEKDIINGTNKFKRQLEEEKMVLSNNCRVCPDYKNNKCDAKAMDCLCRRCPRTMGKCIITKYCSETESILIFDDEYDDYE